MADRTTRVLLEIMALDKATAVLGSMMTSLQAWADKMNGVGEQTELTSEQLEVAQVRLQGASDAYAVSLEAQATALGKLEAAQASVVESQQAAVSAQLEAQRAAVEASTATGDEAIAMEAYAKTAMTVAAETANAVQVSVAEQVAAYDRLMAADALVAKRSQQMADAQIVSNDETKASTASLGKLGPALVATGAAIGYIGYKSVEVAANFQTMMTKLVTSAGQSASGLSAVSSQVLAISNQTGISANDLAKALYYVDSANYHDAQSTTILAAAAKGARDEMANTADVTNALTTVMVNYHLSADKATMVMNQMITAVSLGKTNLQEYSVALAQVLPVAAAAGLSFGEVGGALSTMTAKGMTAQQAAQDLAFSIRSLQGPNGQAVKEMEQLGLSATQVQQSLGKNGLVATFEELQNAVVNKMGKTGVVVMDAFNKSKTAAADAKRMFDSLPPSLQGLASQLENGTISANNWRLAIRNLSPDQQKLMQEFATMQTNASGFNSFLRAGSPAAQSYTAAMQKMMGGAAGLNTALMLVSGKSLPQFQSNVEAVTNVAKRANNEVDGWTQVQGTFNQRMAEAKQTLVNTGIAIGTALLPYVTKLVSAIMSIVGPIGTWISQHQKLIATILAIAGPLLMAIGIMITVTKVIGLVEAATIALGDALDFLAANPIVLAITAIIVVAYLLITHWKQVKQILSDVWNWMKVAAKDVADFFVRIWNDVAGFTKRIWNDIATFLKVLWAEFKAVWNATGGKLVADIEHAWDVVSSSFKKEWDRISADLSEIWGELVTLWNDTGGKLVSLISDNWNSISAGVSEAWHMIFDPIESAIRFIMTFLKANLQVIEGVIKGAWDIIRLYVKVAWDLIWGIIKAAWDFIYGIIKGALEYIWGIIKSYFDVIKGTFEAAWDTIKGIFNTVLDTIKDILKVFIDLVTGQWHKAWIDFVRTVVDAWNNIWDTVKNVLNDIKNTVINGAKDVWNGFINGAETALGSIWKAMQDVYHSVLNAFHDAINWLIQAGKDVINGLINGVKSMIGVVSGAMGDVGRTIKDTITKGLGINSPSTVFHGYGVNIMQGMTNGINASASQAARAAQAAAKGIAAAASGSITGSLSVGGAGGVSLFAGAASAGARPSVNFTADLRGAQIAGPQSIQWVTDQLNKNFVQKVVPTSGTTIRRMGG